MPKIRGRKVWIAAGTMAMAMMVIAAGRIDLSEDSLAVRFDMRNATVESPPAESAAAFYVVEVKTASAMKWKDLMREKGLSRRQLLDSFECTRGIREPDVARILESPISSKTVVRVVLRPGACHPPAASP